MQHLQSASNAACVRQHGLCVQEMQDLGEGLASERRRKVQGLVLRALRDNALWRAAKREQCLRAEGFHRVNLLQRVLACWFVALQVTLDPPPPF